MVRVRPRGERTEEASEAPQVMRDEAQYVQLERQREESRMFKIGATLAGFVVLCITTGCTVNAVKHRENQRALYETREAEAETKRVQYENNCAPVDHRHVTSDSIYTQTPEMVEEKIEIPLDNLE